MSVAEWLQDTARYGLSDAVDRYVGAPTGYTQDGRPGPAQAQTGTGIQGGGTSAPVDNTPGERAPAQMMPGVDSRALMLGGAGLAVVLIVVLAVR